jgi:hypothetical protein
MTVLGLSVALLHGRSLKSVNPNHGAAVSVQLQNIKYFVPGGKFGYRAQFPRYTDCGSKKWCQYSDSLLTRQADPSDPTTCHVVFFMVIGSWFNVETVFTYVLCPPRRSIGTPSARETRKLNQENPTACLCLTSSFGYKVPTIVPTLPGTRSTTWKQVQRTTFRLPTF